MEGKFPFLKLWEHMTFLDLLSHIHNGNTLWKILLPSMDTAITDYKFVIIVSNGAKQELVVTIYMQLWLKTRSHSMLEILYAYTAGLFSIL